MSAYDLPSWVNWPRGWRNVPLWAMFDRIKDVGHPDEEMLSVYREYGVIRKSSRDDNTNQTAENRDIYQLIDDGWFVVNRMKAWQGSVGVSPLRGIVSGHYICFRPRHAEDPRFLNWLLRSSAYTLEYARMSRGVRPGQIEIDNDELHGLRIALPPLEEQRRIADFLDAETARVDKLASSRWAQVSVLDELELARIGEHLSEIENTGPVYAYFNVQLGKMLNADRAAGDNQQPYLRNANVHWYEIDTADMSTMDFEPGERMRYGVQPGDLLVCEGGAGVAEAAVWEGTIPTCFYQKSLHRVRARGEVPVEWLMYWLRYAKEIGVFNAEGNLATIPHLTGEQLAEHRIPIPKDGHRRVTELASEIATIRETQRKMTAANELLAERKQALITAAVTGQIDVTTAGGVAV